MATSPDNIENAMNPMAGSRLQHTCTPEPEQTPRAEQHREGGTRIRPAATERSFTAAEEDAPSRGTQVSAWVSPGGLAKDRSDASATAARFGAFRLSRSGSGRFRNTEAQEQSWVFVACGGAREAISRGAYRCYRYTAGIPQALWGAKSNRWIRPPVVSGQLEMGRRSGQPDDVHEDPRGPGGESCQGRGGRREEAIYLQLGRGAHVFTEQSAKINHWIRKIPARRPPPNDRRTPKGGRSREASARDSAQHP